MKLCDISLAELPHVATAECDCGEHAFPTKWADGDGVAAIGAILSSLSVAAVVSECEASAREYMRKLRRAGIAAHYVAAGDSERAAQAVAWEEDTRLIVAYGGERAADFAKRLGILRNLPVFVVVCSPAAVTVLSPHCALYDENVRLLKKGAVPVGVAIDESVLSARDLPAAFGGICGVAAVLFDREAYARAVGNPVCGAVRKVAFDLIYKALDLSGVRERTDKSLPTEMARIALALSRLSQGDAFDFVRGAPDDCARTADMLFRREDRTLLPSGELRFVFGAVLSGLYGEFARLPRAFTPPPDNNLRADRLVEYLGWNALTATRAAVSRMPDVGLAVYRIHEYGDELQTAIADVRAVFAEGKKRFKRLYSDDGYGLYGRLDITDVKTVVALAPDTFPVFGSALLLMREFGLLERYL